MKKIVFKPENNGAKEFFESPKPSSKYIPRWYRESEKYQNGKFDPSLEPPQLYGMKYCAPFLDGLTAGYMITTQYDIFIKNNNNQEVGVYPSFQSDKVANQILQRDLSSYPVPDGFIPIHFLWKYFFTIQLPKGYSALFTHPLNRYDLPFLTTSGIIDCDDFHSTGTFEFFIKKDFSGLIPKGTPFVQVIPFKRDSWKSEYDDNDKDIEKHEKFLMKKTLSFMAHDLYRKLFWKPKKYV
jgi:hypothetical protein